MMINQKVFVRRVRVSANGGRTQCSVSCRKKASHRRLDIFASSGNLAPHGADGRTFSTVMESYFYTVAQIRKAVEKARSSNCHNERGSARV